MRNPLTKLAVAAAIAVACITGLFMWTGTQSSMALADVLTRLQQVSVYMYQMSMTTTGTIGDNQPLEQEIQATALMSQELGMKMTIETNTDTPLPGDPGRLAQEMYMLPHKGRMVTIMPGLKKYMQIDFDDAQFAEKQKQNNDPRAMVEQILNCDYVSLGRSTIDGVEVEGFQTTDPNYTGGMMGEVDVTIWVDVETQLPVRSEMDMQMMDDMRVHAVMHDFQWDVPVDASEFDPIIPEDYTTLTGGPVKMPTMNEETAIQGLKLFAELTGHYPEKLDMMTLMSAMKDIAEASVSENDIAGTDMPDDPDFARRHMEKNMEEHTRKLTEKLMPIMSVGSFYGLLVQDQKHPAYHGNVVTPEDADQVLMRWQVSETEYRVIFGSLHAETVSTEVLAELEKTLPKP